jgi:hypothetical protein
MELKEVDGNQANTNKNVSFITVRSQSILSLLRCSSSFSSASLSCLTRSERYGHASDTDFHLIRYILTSTRSIVSSSSAQPEWRSWPPPGAFC